MEEKTSNAGHEQHHAGHGPGCFFCWTAKPIFERCWSDMTKDHFRNSRIEFLKGIRSLIDDRISNLSRAEAKGTHVNVE
jgi:hypothetical protein